MVMEKDNKKRGNNPRLLSPLPDPFRSPFEYEPQRQGNLC